jgi:hypothetical protein
VRLSEQKIDVSPTVHVTVVLPQIAEPEEPTGPETDTWIAQPARHENVQAKTRGSVQLLAEAGGDALSSVAVRIKLDHAKAQRCGRMRETRRRGG